MATFLDTRVITSLFLALALFGSPSVYSQSLVTTGDTCDVKNPAAKDVRRDFGAFINIRSEGNFNIACPLNMLFGASDYSVIVAFENFNENGRDQRYSCTLTEYDVANFRINSYRQGMDVSSGFVRTMAFENVELDDILNRLHLICTLPPRSAVGHVVVDNNF